MQSIQDEIMKANEEIVDNINRIDNFLDAGITAYRAKRSMTDENLTKKWLNNLTKVKEKNFDEFNHESDLSRRLKYSKLIVRKSEITNQFIDLDKSIDSNINNKVRANSLLVSSPSTCKDKSAKKYKISKKNFDKSLCNFLFGYKNSSNNFEKSH